MRTPLVLALLACLVVGQGSKPKTPNYLAQAQLDSGGWPAKTKGEAHTGASAQAVLAFLGAGYTDRGTGTSNPYAPVVAKGLNHLIAVQDDVGRLDSDLAVHAQATLALAEAFGMTRSPRYQNVAQRAVLYLQKQQKKNGSFGDLETSAWAGMALRSATHAKVGVDAAATARIVAWLKSVTGEDGVVRGHGPKQRATAMVILARIVLGEKPRSSPAIKKGVAFCLKTPPSASAVDERYWYFATLAIFQNGGKQWRQWNAAMRAAIIKTQLPDGSWKPGPHALYGKVGATAMLANCLSVYYRYERVFGLGGGAGGAFRGRGGRRNLRAGGGSARQPYNTESYDRIESNDFQRTWDNDVSTFSIDVDTASYANVRRMLTNGRLPPKDAVRVEELINYFPYDYLDPDPRDGHPLAARVEVAACPWTTGNRLVRIGLQAPRFKNNERPPSNLVFLLDVSGSMKSERKLPLLKRSLTLMAKHLEQRDRVAMVVYAGRAGLVLPSTPGNERETIIGALEELQAGGSTAGGAGIELAYKVARKHHIEGGINRVILCTDGDFNVGITDRGTLTRRVEKEAKAGTDLSILGFGMGNYKDARLEELSNKGNGNYAYIDTFNEARKVLVGQLAGTLWTLANNVKIQVFFNPKKVAAWRLIGYENRLLAKKDFNDDKKDAGDIGAGHSVTALFEVVPAGADAPLAATDQSPFIERARLTNQANEGALLRLRVRYRPPEAKKSVLMEQDVRDGQGAFEAASIDFRWAAAVAEFGMLLRESKHKGDASYESVEKTARAALGPDRDGYRKEFLGLVDKAREATAKSKAQ
ncbi:MAG: YfbK domain-containing protein [Planctomycetota bacterium]|jgi:Ca-activated chloride channel family protein